jgi:peptidoglycan/LPS O-acetylase OafA/YrhL
MTARQGWTLGRRPGLDGLRGIAVILVVIGHTDQGLRNLGSVGVTVFFALSGFLITSLLLAEQGRTGRVSFRGFYARRARRLLPALGVMLIPVVTWELALGLHPVGSVLAVLAYVGNWFCVAGGDLHLLGPLWSLGVEEQFYVVAPILLLVAVRRLTPSAFARCCAGLTVAAFGWRFVLVALDASPARIYNSTDTRIDALLVGCTLAAALSAGWRPGTLPRLVGPAAVVALLVLGAIPGGLNHDVLAPSVVVLIAPALLLTGLAGTFTSPLLRWFGDRSYAIYLWNYPLILGLQIMFGRSLLLPILASAASLVAAELSWRLVERPILGKRHGETAVPSARAPESLAR